MGDKKMGRPTNCPLDKSLRIRIDSDTLSKLEFCSQTLKVGRAELIRDLIKKAYVELQK